MDFSKLLFYRDFKVNQIYSNPSILVMFWAKQNIAKIEITKIEVVYEII